MADDQNEPGKSEAPKGTEAQDSPLTKQGAANELGESLALVATSVGRLVQALATIMGKQVVDNLDTIGKQVTNKIDDGLATLVGDDKPEKPKKPEKK